MSLLLLRSAASGGGSVPTFHSLLPPTGNSTDLATYVTDIIDPLPNRLILVSINCYIAAGAVQPPTPTVTGNGITYTLEKSQPIDATGADQSTLFVFRGMSSAPTKGAITIAFGSVMGNCAWNVDQSSADVDTTGTNGSGAIAQASVGATSATTVTASPTTTFGTAMTAGNAAYFVCGIETNGPQTPRAGWVETADSSAISLVGIEAQYINGTDTDGSSTWATAARAGTVLLEIKAGATSPNGLVAGRASSATGSVNTLPGVRHPTPVLNDIEILASASDATQTLAIDALFTQQLNLVDGSLRAYLGSNVSDGSEVGDISISSTATANRQVGCVAVFRGYSGVEASNLQSLAEASTDNSHDSPSITPVYTGSCIVYVYYERVSTGTVSPQAPPSPLTTAVEFGTGLTGGTYVQIAYQSSGVVAGTPVSPGPWTGAGFVATGSAYVLALELIPSTAAPLTVDQTDSAGLTDAAALVVAPILTDTAGLTDGLVWVQSKSLSDSAGLTDTAALSVVLVTTDSTGLVDSAIAGISIPVAQTDSTGLTDGTLLGQSRVTSDSVGLTDAATLAQSKIITDSSGLTDASLVESGRALGQTDSTGLTDAQAFSQTHGVTDSAGLVDATALTASKIATDSAGLTDAALVGLLRDQTATDSAGLTDAAAIERASILTDLVGLADAAAFEQLRSLTDSSGLVDAALVTTVVPVPHITPRPDTGITPRPFTTTTARPSSGRTSRPSNGITVRPDGGITVRP